MNETIFTIGGAALEIYGYPQDLCQLRDSNPGKLTITVGGAAKKVAAHLVRYGLKPELVTALGNDARADIILKDCALAGIGTGHVFRTEGSSPAYMCTFDRDRDLLCGISDMDAFSALTPEALEPLLPAINGTALCLADSNLTEECLGYLASHLTVPMVYEPVSLAKAKRIGKALPEVSILRANRFEAGLLSGCSCDTVRGTLRAAEALLKAGVRYSYISLGSDGIVYCAEEDMGHIPAEELEPVNKAGAGEALSAAVIKAILDGKSVAECAAFGNSEAAKYCRGEYRPATCF
ncbi:MAG: PfkB family carbohydrate kinase [Clostridia bacterium]|nr:PfkB family carbohydrate kinase [Clostridia bacterium]